MGASSRFGTVIAIRNGSNSFAIQSSNSERSLAYWAQREGLTQAVPAFALRVRCARPKSLLRFCRTLEGLLTLTLASFGRAFDHSATSPVGQCPILEARDDTRPEQSR